MRIFPEGAREWLKPTGQVFVVISAVMLVIAAVLFAQETWILKSWPRTEAVIVSARLADATGSDEDNLRTCSAVYTVIYFVAGEKYTTEAGGHIFTSDCGRVEALVKAAAGRHVVALYDADKPSGAYVDPGFNLEFFLAPFILTLLSAGFAIAGFAGWKVGSWMDRRRI